MEETEKRERLQVRALFSEVTEILVGFLILIFHILISPLLCPILLYRWILSKTSYFLNPSLGEIVNCRGHFLAAENFTNGNSSRAVIVAAATVEGHVTLETAQELLLERMVGAKHFGKVEGVLKYPELGQYITTWPSIFGFYFWKPEKNFDIREHVVKYQPAKSFSDSELESWIETLINQPFKHEKSPWQVYVTNNYVNQELSSESMTVLTVKTHHCLSDGFGLLYTIISSLGNGMPIIPPRPNYAKRNALDRLSFLLTFPFRSLYELSKFFALTFETHLWKISDSKKSWKQIYCKTPIVPLEKIKGIKRKFGVSFTSVLLSAYAAASQKTLQRRKRTREKKLMGNGVPCAMILPLPNHPKVLRNHCTGAYINLPTMECDPVQRLRECEKQVNRAKCSVLPFYGRIISSIGGSFPASWTKYIAKNRQIPVGISNFPVGEQPYELCTKKMLHITMGAGAQVGVAGLNFFVYTYNNGIQFTVTVENALMTTEELKNMTQSIVDEIDHLYLMELV